MRYTLSIILSLQLCFSWAQYAPPAGQAGSTAIWRDSSIFVNWASQCTIARGWQNSSDTSLGRTTVGSELSAVGKAGLNGVVSLGDGGMATCTFPFSITNGPGPDFAVFENSFDGLFLELAFVEVSSNGIDFFRFPAHSLTDTLTQIGTFDLLDATKINNLAGKYRAGFGTPFDLDELAGNPLLDINQVTHVRVIDVVGSINEDYATRDAFGNKVNDPWPTPFESSGFDLDAIGVIHQQLTASANSFFKHFSIYPNPAAIGASINISTDELLLKAEVYNMNGKLIYASDHPQILLQNISAGVYKVQVKTTTGLYFERFVLY
jgi:hypothetical protein